MRTARTFTICWSLLLGGVPGPGGCTCLVGGVYLPGPGGVYLPGPGGVPGPRGVYLPGPGGTCLVSGGVPAWSRWGTWSQGGVPAWSGGYLPGLGGCTCLVLGGVPAWSRGYTCLVPGGVRGGTWSGTSTPVDRMTHAYENITLPQTSFASGNNANIHQSLLPEVGLLILKLVNTLSYISLFN